MATGGGFWVAIGVFKGVRAKTNSQGWRGPEYSIKKDRKIIRIIGIGDSIMFGWGVDETERYMDVLVNLLNDKFYDLRFESYNFAVPGYNLVNEVEVLKQFAITYQPDLIIYGFCFNDLELPNFIYNNNFLFSSRSVLLDYFKPYQQSMFLQNSFEETPVWRINNPDNVPDKYKDQAGITAFTNALKELERIGNYNDIPIVFLCLFDGAHGKAVLKCSKTILENIVFFDTGKEYKEVIKTYGFNNIFLSSKDPHPSIIYHEAIAKSILRQLIEKQILLKNHGAPLTCPP